MTGSILGVELPRWARDASDAAGRAGSDVTAALAIARDVGTRLSCPGTGRTLLRWAVLAGLARGSVTVARVTEAHTDALAILAEAGQQPEPGSTWGVFAAEAAGTRLEAVPAPDGLRLTGAKPWCSLGDVLDRALVTAHAGEQRQLFAVDLADPGVRAGAAQGWVARGLPTVVSVGVEFADVPARPVGEDGWYLTRPGFAWGGIGVAACWFGAATGVADALRNGRDDDLTMLARGRADAALHAGACALRDAAGQVDAGVRGGEELLALRTRAIVAGAAEQVLAVTTRTLGPAPLAFDEAFAARVADLGIYLRQHHAERDLAALGRRAAGST